MGQARIHILPPYSPNLNPAELVWSYVKRQASQKTFKTKAELKRILTTAFVSLNSAPGKVQGFFREADCQYILA